MPSDVADLRGTIVPKSDQLNAEQLLAGPMTLTVTGVTAGGTDEQPVSIAYTGDNGRPYKPCKTMRKLLILAWGSDGREWAGKSMTVFNDPAVRFGGMDVGGIRISHLSHIRGPIKASLTATKGKKAQYVVDVLRVLTLAEVLDAINSASNVPALASAGNLARGLTAPADIATARTAYAAKSKILSEQTEALK